MASNDVTIRKYIDLLFRYKKTFIITALVIMTLSLLLSYALPKKYEAKSVVFIEKNIMGELVKGLAVSPSIEDKVKVLTYAMSSRTLLLKVFDDLDMNVRKMSDKQVEELVKETQKDMDIKTKDKEGLFMITFRNENPKFARDFVNTLIRRYIEENVASKREESYGANTFLAEQIASFKQNLDKAEDKISSFKQGANAMVGIDESTIYKEIHEYQRRLDELRVRRQQLDEAREILLRNDPTRKRLETAEKRLAELRVSYTETYPEVAKLKAEVESLRVQVKSRPGGQLEADDAIALQRVESELKALRVAEESSRRNLAENQAALSRIPSAKLDLEELEREKKQSKDVYEQLMARHNQSEISKQMEIQDKTSTFRVVDPAVTSQEPVSPNRVRIMLIGIAAGFAGAFGLIFLLDQMDTTVRSVANIKALGVPVLGVIPRMENLQDLMLQKKRDFRLFNISGAYFSLLVVVLILEALKISLVDAMFSAINFQQNVSAIKSKIMAFF